MGTLDLWTRREASGIVALMQLISGKTAAGRISGILHPQYQVHGFAVHLTVRSVSSLDPTGQIDFGGGEYMPAERRELSAHTVRPEDTYRWWDLGRGPYFIVCNETLNLASDEIALIEPEDRLLRAGAWHVPLFVRGHVDPVELLLEVGVARLRMKENARIARVRLFRLDQSKSGAKASRSRAAKSKATK